MKSDDYIWRSEAAAFVFHRVSILQVEEEKNRKLEIVQ